MTNSVDDNHVDQSGDDKSATYRCVCGQTVQLSGKSTECPSCGRHFEPDFLRKVGADTVSIDSDQFPARLRSRAEDDAIIGKRLGHFKILSRIGDGGMGSVYHALDESLQRYVALKVIRSDADGTEGANLERLFQEARAQARVNHPHVVHVYYVGMEEKTPFLAMELVGNGTLSDRMREGTIPFADIVRFAIQISRALGCAAEYEIVHGDIKPSNVLLVDKMTVKLSDFGLARQLTSETSSTKFSGTPDYMPPESTRGGGVDHRGDMYSLGVTLFQMTFGRLPYTAADDGAISDRLRLHREAAVEFPERWPAELPEAWRSLLARLLDKDPGNRFTDFAELESELKKVAPVNLPIANLFSRGIAWGIDCMLLIVGMVVIRVAAGLVEATLHPDATVNVNAIEQLGMAASLFNSILFGGLLTGVALLQAHWGNTTGKRFLQILIVDQHGLKPRRRVLAARTAFQFSWAWWLVISGPLTLMGMQTIVSLLGWLVPILWIFEIGSVLLREGASVHDSVLGTRVVLDASPQSTAARYSN